MSLLSGFTKVKNPLIYSIGSGIFATLSVLLANKLKNNYVEESKSNFFRNSEKLINFLMLKKEKVLFFESEFDRLCAIFENEAVELLDLISGLK